MKNNARTFAPTVYDQAEVDRCVDQVFSLLLEAAREKRLRQQRAGSQLHDPAPAGSAAWPSALP